MRAIVVHPGVQHAYSLATELYRRDALSGLYTGFAIASGGTLEFAYELLPLKIKRRVANRKISELSHSLVHLQPIVELAASALARYSGDHQDLFYRRNGRFQRNIPRYALENADVVVGFDTSSWLLARRCRDIDKPLVVVQTTAHSDTKELVQEEIATRFPVWAETDEVRKQKLREAEREELHGAKLIVTSSTFTKQTLVESGVPLEKIRVVPHGVDCNRFSPGAVIAGRPFRFVFAGLVNAHKGVPILLQAWQQLKPANAELWIVGRPSGKVEALLPNLRGVRYLGQVPQSELPAIFGQCDVFVFPSYSEGFALVLLQAMACGLPIITTSSTAGPDLLAEGGGGWLISRGNVEQLAQTMSGCIGSSDKVRQEGRRAREIAERFSWEEYGNRWLAVLKEAVAGDKECVPSTGDIETPEVLQRRIPSQNTVSNIADPVKAQADPLVVGEVLLAHPGTQYSKHLAYEFHRHGVLGKFYTCLAYGEKSTSDRAIANLPAGLRWRLANRRIVGIPNSLLRTEPWLEIAALAALRCGMDEQKVLFRRNAAFQRGIPDSAIRAATSVIGFDTSSWSIGHRARAMGRSFILDQSIGHPRTFARIAAQLSKEFSEWAEAIPVKSEEDYSREATEHAQATCIVVPSRYVMRTLHENGVDANKIRVNPFGVDLTNFFPSRKPAPLNTLKFLFAGSLRPRKGFPLLLEAWRQLPANHGAELWVVGGGNIPTSVRSSMPSNIRFFGHLPQSHLAELFRQCHLFVFPSYFEGLAQVQIEAAASGLPVIGTENSGCEEIVRHGETGLVLPTGDVDALRESITFFLSEPEHALTMRDKLLRERTQWSWSNYGDRWMSILGELAQ
jgi:starch synthase